MPANHIQLIAACLAMVLLVCAVGVAMLVSAGARTDRLPSEDRRRQYYRILSSEADRLQQLVERLLHFGRMEAGAARYRFEIVEVGALARTVAAGLEAHARDNGVRLELDGAAAGVLVRGDDHALGVALRNLVDNAIKYSPGQPVVRIEWRNAGRSVEIRVIDNGLGIPPAEHQSVFRKFVRGQSAAAANSGGTGVGCPY